MKVESPFCCFWWTTGTLTSKANNYGERKSFGNGMKKKSTGLLEKASSKVTIVQTHHRQTPVSASQFLRRAQIWILLLHSEKMTEYRKHRAHIRTGPRDATGWVPRFSGFQFDLWRRMLCMRVATMESSSFKEKDASRKIYLNWTTFSGEHDQLIFGFKLVKHTRAIFLAQNLKQKGFIFSANSLVFERTDFVLFYIFCLVECKACDSRREIFEDKNDDAALFFSQRQKAEKNGSERKFSYVQRNFVMFELKVIPDLESKRETITAESSLRGKHKICETRKVDDERWEAHVQTWEEKVGMEARLFVSWQNLGRTWENKKPFCARGRWAQKRSGRSWTGRPPLFRSLNAGSDLWSKLNPCDKWVSMSNWYWQISGSNLSRLCHDVETTVNALVRKSKILCFRVSWLVNRKSEPCEWALNTVFLRWNVSGDTDFIA